MDKMISQNIFETQDVFPKGGGEVLGLSLSMGAYVVELEGKQPGLQGVKGNPIVEDFGALHGALLFSKMRGDGTLANLENSVESVVDTGTSIVFNFIGGGSLTLDGVTGYSDFTSLSMDYPVGIVA